jgi:hypothetical protein
MPNDTAYTETTKSTLNHAGPLYLNKIDFRWKFVFDRTVFEVPLYVQFFTTMTMNDKVFWLKQKIGPKLMLI